MKLKTVYICQNCQFQTSKWAGKCNDCGTWNSMMEDVINVGKEAKKSRVVRRSTTEKPQGIQLKSPSVTRTITGISEWDQVLGGGMVEGSLVLLSGEPGIGKSTLTLQVVDRMAAKKESVLYVTGEESVDQVSDRAKRLGCSQENVQLLFETQLESLLTTIELIKPEFLVVDSIQVMTSAEIPGSAGSISQVRFVTEVLMNTIKRLKIPTLLIGHVNKDGNIAGPKVLEHLVDTVLILEGERDRELRMLRAVKNRFGSVSEVGLFEMTEKGMVEVLNPGERTLENRPENTMGSCLTMSLEGHRPLLMEVQALVSKTNFGYPKRTSSGFDRNRLELLVAVLQKHTKLNLADQDIYINVVGGLRLQDPAADLAICMALASSLLKKTVPRDLVVFGEVGLTGEVRPGFRAAEREKAVKKLGLKSLDKVKQITKALSQLE